MRVFKACCIIIRQRWFSFATYFAVFIVLAVALTTFTAEQLETDFTAMRPNFTVINRDSDTPLSNGLLTYLREHGNEVVLEDDRETLQDATFFHATSFIAILPEGFHEAFFSDAPLAAETVMTVHTVVGAYVDHLINQYFRQVRLLRAAGFTDETELVAAALADLSLAADVEVVQFGTGAPINRDFRMYMMLICYIILVLVILCVCNILLVFRRPDLRMRNICAAIKPRSLSLQQILCGVLLSMAAWVLLVVMGLALYGGGLSDTDGRIVGLAILNSFVWTLVALSIAALAGAFVNNNNTLSAVSNFLSLGLCFLGGVFVPIELLGDGMLAVARFTPAYWYATALNRVGSLTSFSGEALVPVWQAMLIQLAFAAAIFCMALVVGKHQNRSEKFFGSVRTELEA